MVEEHGLSWEKAKVSIPVFKWSHFYLPWMCMLSNLLLHSRVGAGQECHHCEGCWSLALGGLCLGWKEDFIQHYVFIHIESKVLNSWHYSYLASSSSKPEQQTVSAYRGHLSTYVWDGCFNWFKLCFVSFLLQLVCFRFAIVLSAAL